MGCQTRPTWIARPASTPLARHRSGWPEFLTTVAGALLAGVGATLTWVTVGSEDAEGVDTVTKGIDLWDGQVVLACALVMLIAVQVTVMTGVVCLLVGAATGFSWILATHQVPQMLGQFIGSISEGRVIFLLMSIAVFLFFGMILDGLPAILIFFPILFPIAMSLGDSPVTLWSSRHRHRGNIDRRPTHWALSRYYL